MVLISLSILKQLLLLVVPVVLLMIVLHSVDAALPTRAPSAKPTATPTRAPSAIPTAKPTATPTVRAGDPTFVPTPNPTTAMPTIPTDPGVYKALLCPKLPWFGNVSTDCILSVPHGSNETIEVDALDMLNYQLSYEQASPLKIRVDVKPAPFPAFLVSKYAKDIENIDRLVGVALDGVPIYTALNQNLDDIFQDEMDAGGRFRIDRCGGTYGPTPDGYRYHYRVMPTCILNTNLMAKRRQEYIADVHELLQYFYDIDGPQVLGFTKTGFPIYTPFDKRGRLQEDLDSCNGKFVDNSYGYYVTLSFPYISGCDGPGVLGSDESDVLSAEILPNVAGRAYTACPGGYYPSTAFVSNGCIACPAGKYSLASFSVPGRDPCSGVPPPGYYTTPGSTKPIICAAGRYGSSYGLSNAECSGLCERGYFCPEGSTSKQQFPCGNETVFCPAGSGVKYIVDNGFHTGPTEISEKFRHFQVECLPGSYCTRGVSSPCPAGRYGLTKALSNHNCTDVCPQRHYCPEGSSKPIKCPAGTFGASKGLSTPACSGLAKPGYWTTEGSLSPTEMICAPGQYGAEHGLATKECSPDCEPLGAPNGTSSAGSQYCNIRKCSAGYICPAGSTSPKQVECGGSNVYCPPGSVIQTPVDVGYYTVDINGDYSIFDTIYPTNGTKFATKAKNPITPDITTKIRVTQILCEPGYYCQYGSKYKCPRGSYGGEFGQSSPVCSGPCLSGFYCHTGSSEPRQNKCGEGPDVYCPMGSYGPTFVPPGYYSINGTITTRSAIMKCNPGSYCINGISRLCPPGLYSKLGSPTEDCDGPCDPGYYCPEGSISAQQISCPPGRFGVAGMIDSMCTGACMKGYYCPATSTTPYQNECGGEYVYCPQGSGAPTPVSGGYYSTGNNVTTRFAQSKCEITANTGTPPAADDRKNICPDTTVP